MSSCFAGKESFGFSCAIRAVQGILKRLEGVQWYAGFWELWLYFPSFSCFWIEIWNEMRLLCFALLCSLFGAFFTSHCAVNFYSLCLPKCHCLHSQKSCLSWDCGCLVFRFWYIVAVFFDCLEAADCYWVCDIKQ